MKTAILSIAMLGALAMPSFALTQDQMMDTANTNGVCNDFGGVSAVRLNPENAQQLLVTCNEATGLGNLANAPAMLAGAFVLALAAGSGGSSNSTTGTN